MKKHIFIIGSKSIGQYGGYETFVDKLTELHQDEKSIKYHVACKANGDGCMDESKLNGVKNYRSKGRFSEFTYHNAHVFKIPVPKIGAAVAIYYDVMSLKYCIRYCKKNKIDKPIFYILACRIGPFIKHYKREIQEIGGVLYINPDGHEWKRAKWSAPIRRYWKTSEKKMVKAADLVICDSTNIEKYIREEYGVSNTTYISYGADLKRSELPDDDPAFMNWLKEKKLDIKQYYLVVGRFVPENNYETMIREFMASHSKKSFALITNVNDNFLLELEKKLHWKNDERIKFVGTVYDKELLKKIRENAYGYFHGHEVGGTNPSLLEALGSTDLNLLLSVGFNEEVALDGALYWKKDEGDLARLIDEVDKMSLVERKKLGDKAKQRIRDAFSWEKISEMYKGLWLS